MATEQCSELFPSKSGKSSLIVQYSINHSALLVLKMLGLSQCYKLFHVLAEMKSSVIKTKQSCGITDVSPFMSLFCPILYQTLMKARKMKKTNRQSKTEALVSHLSRGNSFCISVMLYWFIGSVRMIHLSLSQGEIWVLLTGSGWINLVLIQDEECQDEAIMLFEVCSRSCV